MAQNKALEEATLDLDKELANDYPPSDSEPPTMEPTTEDQPSLDGVTEEPIEGVQGGGDGPQAVINNPEEGRNQLQQNVDHNVEDADVH
ncbi:hypothetical protein ACA910_013869 [Epithemia clementina (nom. ined.)]